MPATGTSTSSSAMTGSASPPAKRSVRSRPRRSRPRPRRRRRPRVLVVVEALLALRGLAALRALVLAPAGPAGPGPCGPAALLVLAAGRRPCWLCPGRRGAGRASRCGRGSVAVRRSPAGPHVVGRAPRRSRRASAPGRWRRRCRRAAVGCRSRRAGAVGAAGAAGPGGGDRLDELALAHAGGAGDAEAGGDLLQLGEHHAVQPGAGTAAGLRSRLGGGRRRRRGVGEPLARSSGGGRLCRPRVDDVGGRVAQDAFLKEAGFERAPRSSGGGLSRRWTTRDMPRIRPTRGGSLEHRPVGRLVRRPQ